MWARRIVLASALFFVQIAAAHAQTAGEGAREAFEQGTKLVKEERWAEALASFERASVARPHATTSFNIGFCLRALGRYSAAAKSFREALARSEGSRELAPSLAQDARAFEAEMIAALSHVALVVAPADAAISIDGRALVPDGSSFVLGSETSEGTALSDGKATVLLDPGRHLVSLSRKGYARVSTPLSVTEGSIVERRFDMTSLPATLRIESTPRGAAVRIADIDVGLTPLAVERPPGNYRVTLLQKGYSRYETTMKVGPGEMADVRAGLTRETPSLFSRWWFWTTVGVVAAGAAVTTYVLTRPAEPLTGGSLGWVAGR